MLNDQIQQRHLDMLQTALGAVITQCLEKDDVLEVMANPDGKVWLDTLSQGKYLTSTVLSENQRLNIIKLVASLNNLLVHANQPEVACELAFAAARFQAWIPPVSPAPTFVIRKKAKKIFSLENYMEEGWLNTEQAQALKKAVRDKLNILVAGGTGSGKTTFANALLHELSSSNERIIVLEDLPELQLSAEDVVTLHTAPDITMRDLVKSCLRMRPDRIIIGEVRDGAALDLLKAWNTGHPGGICTLHANRADSVLARLEDLILEVVPEVPQRLVHEAVDVIIFMQKLGFKNYHIEEIKPVSAKAKTLF
jgi:type IV secretion system protein VirB11